MYINIWHKINVFKLGYVWSWVLWWLNFDGDWIIVVLMSCFNVIYEYSLICETYIANLSCKFWWIILMCYENFLFIVKPKSQIWHVNCKFLMSCFGVNLNFLLYVKLKLQIWHVFCKRILLAMLRCGGDPPRALLR